MNHKTVRSAVFALLCALATVGAFAQTSADISTRAMSAYETESFEKAFSLVAETVPETSKNTALKKQASEALAAIGVKEYDARNYKNAYDGFRKALKYDPSNTRATQYFLKMRKDMNTAALKNEGAPRDKGSTAAANKPSDAPAPVSAPVAGATPQTPAPAAATPAQTPAAVSPAPPVDLGPSKSEVELSELKSALQEADRRMRTMESTVAGTSKENEALKDQAEKQIKLLQTFMETQAQKAPSAPTVVTQKQSPQEQAMIAQTMALLAKMADREKTAPQVIVQTDPDLKNIVQRMDERQRNLDSQGPGNTVLLIAVVAIGCAVLLLVVFFVILALRAKKRTQRNEGPRYGAESEITPTAYQLNYGGPSVSARGTPLLEFIGGAQNATGRGEDFDIRKDLMKAERLNRMYDEVRAGTLSWNTVRDYVGELDVALKADILKVVERKLDEGDLLSSDAILPIIFPFLTDYDDFIREKSERLAHRALIEFKGGPGGSGGSGGTDAESSAKADPLSLSSLMLIPKELQGLFKNQDQTLVTAKLSRGVGSALGLSTEDCNLLYKTALAHDCGYLMIDRDRLQKTIAKAEISDEDFAFIQSHVALGPTYFEGIELPAQFRDGLLCHHERNDGSGYPNGLKKDDIPLFAKIIGITETLSALVAKRAYREKRDIQNALAIISDGSRTKFDASIVTALEKVASSIGRL